MTEFDTLMGMDQIELFDLVHKRESELTAAQADTKRLDWLAIKKVGCDCSANVSQTNFEWSVNFYTHGHISIRAAIDAAMKEHSDE